MDGSSRNGDEPRFELIDAAIKSERTSDSPHPQVADPAPSRSSQPLPSTETADPASSVARKKKGTASSVKKPKRPHLDGESKKSKKARSTPTAMETSGDEMGADDESDNGPYCLCRGPDDHRWMICCENCEDWYHGECINLDKGIGEALIEKFICPLCTKGNLVTLYKKTCSLGSCRKPARLGKDMESVFCSDEHAQTWWERMIARLPKSKSTSGLDDSMSQDEFMALLQSGLTGLDSDGMWRLAQDPFAKDSRKLTNGNTENEALAAILSDEEKALIERAAKERAQLEEESSLCRKMLTLIELAQDRRRTAIAAGKFGEDICGYDQRLDTISARDAFAAYAKSPEGQTVFATSKLGDPLGEEDELTRGMCEKKRCKAHSGWGKMLVLGLRHQIREMGEQAEEVGEQERNVRDAASERWMRKKAEKNWVEVL